MFAVRKQENGIGNGTGNNSTLEHSFKPSAGYL